MNLRLTTFSSCLILFLCFACQSQNTSTEVAKEEKNQPDPHLKWANALDSDLEALYSLYFEMAVKIFEDGTVLTGNTTIEDYYKELKLQVASIQVAKREIANKDSSYIYEIANLKGKDGKTYKQLVIWNAKKEEKLRELEMIAEVRESPSYITEIDSQRSKWVKLCNEHNAENLVHEVYTPNSIYYNHKPVVGGRADITKEYGYMNREQYQLNLTPIIVEPVNETLAFEIGQCSGSYRGKYVLVWQKMDSGEWQVLMDSNI